MAFSTVNDALGALPDHELGAAASTACREAITWGRRVGPAPGLGPHRHGLAVAHVGSPEVRSARTGEWVASAGCGFSCWALGSGGWS